MATTKITDLTAYTDPVSTDVLPIVDVSGDLTKKVSIADLMENAGSGTEALPGISFDGDPNTGIYRPGADQVAISTNGAGRLFVDSSGNVGIGDSTPDSILDIASDTPILYLEDTATYGSAGSQIIFRGPDSGGTARNMANILGVGSGSNSGKLVFQTRDSGSLADRVTITSDGKLGLGTSVPGQLLQIGEGDTGVGSNVHTIARIEGRAVSGGQQVATLEFNQVTNAPSEFVGASIGIESSAGTRSESELVFKVSQAANTSATEAMRLSHDGRLGIGTTSPAGTLNVQGSTGTPSLTYDTADIVNLDAGTIQLAIGVDSSSPFGAYLQGRASNDAARVISLNPAGGNVGIGITDPSVALHVATTGTPQFRLEDLDTANAYSNVSASNGNFVIQADPQNVSGSTRIGFEIDGSEYARIDSLGRLLVGTSTNIGTEADNRDTLNLVSASGGSLLLGRNDTGVAANNDIGRISFWGNDSDGTYEQCAEIHVEADLPHATGDKPSRMVFSTTAAGASSPTERMRIDRSGRLLVGTVTEGPGDADNLTIADSGNCGITIRSGTTNLGSIFFSDGTSGSAEYDGFIEYSQNSSSMRFGTTSAERMRIDSSGRLLVGTSTARANFQNSTGTAALQVEGTSQATSVFSITRNNATGGPIIRLARSAGTTVGSNTILTSADPEIGRINFEGNDGSEFVIGAQISAEVDGTPGANDMPGRLVFSTTADGSSSPTERMRIDSSGRLLCGTSSASSGEAQYSRFVVQGAGTDPAANAHISLLRGANLATSPVSAGVQIGLINFGDSAGNSFAIIRADTDATTGSNDYPGRLVFSTTADGASSPTERVRIASDGAFYVQDVYDTTTVNAANVEVNSNGRLRRSTSSAKYKTNVQTLEDSYADAILNCRPVWYQSLCNGDNPDHGHWGFIAEEVAEIDPRLVFWKTVDISHDENGSPVETPCDPQPEGVAYDRFVPHLLNLIKRQQQAIETLEAKVAALEAG